MAPGFARWGRGQDSNTLLLQTWMRSTATTEATLSVPFWLSHLDHSADSWLRVAPGFASWGDPETSTLLAGPWYSRMTTEGEEHGVLPLDVAGEATGAGHRGVLSMLDIAPERPHRYTLIPPLLFGHVEDDEGTATWFAQIRIESRAGRSSIWSAPFVFHARSDAKEDNDYTVIPPLGFIWLDDKEAETETLIAGPWVDIETPRSSTTGVVPGYLSHRRKDGGYWDVVPPLAFARWGDEEEQSTLFA